ncbi:MAG: methyltransferase domain-containing protein [Pseudomonadota bacterium]
MSRSRWKLRLYRFLRVKFVAECVWFVRYFWFVRVRRQLRSFDEKSGVILHDYSQNSLLTNRPSERILKLIMPLTLIETLTPDSKVLSIGCRYEWDMLLLCAYGFRAENVRGLDMLSYSPWIDLGNMHAMPYGDSSWDALVLGWVLSYSDDPQRAAREFVRVTRAGGIIAVGVTYYPPERLRALAQPGGDHAAEYVSGERRVQTVAALLELFGSAVGRVYVQHDAPDPGKQGHCLLVFSVRK